MRKMTAAALALSICTFVSPGVALAARATASQQGQTGAVNALLERATNVAPSLFRAELVDANGKVVATERTTDGTFKFEKVPPGNYTVRMVFEHPTADLAGGGWVTDVPAGQSFVTVAAGATSNVTVAITAAAAAAAASAAAGGTVAAAGAAGSPGLLGMGAAGTVLAIGAAAGIITAIALNRNDKSPSR